MGHDLSQDDLDQHVDILRYGQNDAWMQSKPSVTEGTPSIDRYILCEAGQPSTIPKIHVTKGLQWPPPRTYGAGKEHHDVVEPSDLAFIMVIQGRSGSIRPKLVLRTSRVQAGAEMFYEAANGFSVVFSGATLKSNLEKRGDLRYTFKRVGSFVELLSMDEDSTQKKISVLC
jgi:hypothetical protein